MVQIFMTGGTGFVGSTVLQALIENGEVESIKVLVRNKNKATKQFSELLCKGLQLGKKVIPIQGDITSPNFHLSSSELQSIQEADEVYHLAANTSLSTEAIEKETIFNTNVDGTRNLLEIFKNSKHLKKLFYFSTSYACGKIPELIKEDWLEKPSSFRNHYEESKWISEKLIRDYHKKYKIPYIILRPGIISLNSNFEFNGFREHTIYQYGHILREVLKLHQRDNSSIRLVGNLSSTLNIIPIDDVIKMIIEIRSSDKKNSIFNLTNETNFSIKFILKGIENGLGYEPGFTFCKQLNFKDLSESEKFAFVHTQPFWEYSLGDEIVWEIKNTKDIRKKLKINAKDNNWIKEHMKNYFLKRSVHEKQKSIIQI